MQLEYQALVAANDSIGKPTMPFAEILHLKINSLPKEDFLMN